MASAAFSWFTWDYWSLCVSVVFSFIDLCSFPSDSRSRFTPRPLLATPGCEYNLGKAHSDRTESCQKSVSWRVVTPPAGHTGTVQTLPTGAVESSVEPFLLWYVRHPFWLASATKLGLHSPLLFVVLGIKLRVSHMLSKWSTTDLYPEALNASYLALSWLSWVLYFPCWISLSILHMFSWPSNNWGNYVGIFLCWRICQFPLPY